MANGIDIIRIFDCLNDMRNLQTAVKAANEEKAHAQVAMSYTLGDAYTMEYWVDLARESKIWVQAQSVLRIWQAFLFHTRQQNLLEH